MHVDNATLPHFDLTCEKGYGGHRYGVVNARHTGQVTVSGDVGKYAVKWDHLIEGWDFDPSNTNKSLVMEFHALVGNFVSDEMLDLAAAMKRAGDSGEARYSTDTSAGTVSEESSGTTWPSTPQRRIGIKMPRIDFEGNWTRIARFTWTSSVDVDGQEKQMYAQIQGGRRVILTGPQGLFAGFGVLGGFSYPGGNRIYHDPGVDSEILLYTSNERASPVGLVIIGILVCVVVIIAVVAYARVKGLGPFGEKFEDTYDHPTARQNQNDWKKHYMK
jgi:hypothetical protein